jgi:hypothetical protein
MHGAITHTPGSTQPGGTQKGWLEFGLIEHLNKRRVYFYRSDKTKEKGFEFLRLQIWESKHLGEANGR